MEIIQRLQKNLDILIQSMTRVSSRSEMLGAIHQVSGEFKHVFCMTREQTLSLFNGFLCLGFAGESYWKGCGGNDSARGEPQEIVHQRAC